MDGDSPESKGIDMSIEADKKPPNFSRVNTGIGDPDLFPPDLKKFSAETRPTAAELADIQRQLQREGKVELYPAPPENEGPVKQEELQVPPEIQQSAEQASLPRAHESTPNEGQEDLDLEQIQRDIDEYLNHWEAPVREPTPEEIKLFEQFKVDGKVGNLDVIGESFYGKNRARALVLQDPETGERSLSVLGVEGMVGLYYVEPDPTAPEQTNMDTASVYLEKVLRPYERTDDKPISQEVTTSLVATINAFFKDLDPDDKVKLVRRAVGRIGYHNASILARFSAGGFAEEFLKLQLGEQQEVMKTPGVEQALTALVDNEGAFWRLGGDEAKVQREAIRAAIAPTLGIVDPLVAEAAAFTALNVAEKVMHSWGESGRYDGIRLKSREAKDPADAIRAGETYTNKAGVTVAIPADGYVSIALLNALYKDETAKELPKVDAHFSQMKYKYAKFFRDYWDDINFRASNTGQGALQMRGSINFPITFEKPGTPNRGVARDLRRYASLWVTSLSQFTMGADPGHILLTPQADALEIRNRIVNNDDMTKIFYWAPEIAIASKNRGVFADKGKESILNVPLINPNNVTTGDTGETLPPALKNYFGAAEAFSHLSEAERSRAMAHLLEGVLKEVNSDEGRTEFGYLPWNSKIRIDALIVAKKEHAIDLHGALGIIKSLGLSRTIGALQDAIPEFFKGGWDGLRILWATIRGTR